MAALSTGQISALLEGYISSPDPGAAVTVPSPLLDQLSVLLDLLLRWNRSVSLTSIRPPQEIVQRHFGESLFTGCHLAHHLSFAAELLDYGSGAGFPGLPIQLLLPHIHVTLAESQSRKVAFLREAIRELKLPTEVWPRRVEEMPPDRRFDAITLRAVDRMVTSLAYAKKRLRTGGWLALLVGETAQTPLGAQEFLIPGSVHRRLILEHHL
ncbi:MAG TPA: 16S rRNA (guanine(527)-N(7))-methyltransferase RsmG [Acidobacteriaceae bacterium]|jgi:16S rRNA (guanine527-N7)-methyltransferase|nr:16S rRNA (guanine(527)-N(7))-methyltransferase RsmG [Acidobacteriaceae bacterium]